MYDKDDAEAVMKRCRAGTGNYDEANGLHADCYGTIGGAVYELTTLRARLDRAVAENEAWRVNDLQRDGIKYAGGYRAYLPKTMGGWHPFSTIDKAVDALLAEKSGKDGQ